MCKWAIVCQLFSPNRVLASVSICVLFSRQKIFWKYCRIYFLNNNDFTPYTIFASNKFCWDRVAQSAQRLACGMDDSEFESWQGQRFFLFSNSYLLTMVLTHPPILCVPAFTPVVKVPGTWHWTYFHLTPILQVER